MTSKTTTHFMLPVCWRIADKEFPSSWKWWRNLWGTLAHKGKCEITGSNNSVYSRGTPFRRIRCACMYVLEEIPHYMGSQWCVSVCPCLCQCVDAHLCMHVCGCAFVYACVAVCMWVMGVCARGCMCACIMSHHKSWVELTFVATFQGAVSILWPPI